jgi:hypothetical protein
MIIDQLFHVEWEEFKDIPERILHSLPATPVPLQGSMFRAEDTRTERRCQHFVCGYVGCEAFINFWVEERAITIRTCRFTHNHPVTAMNLPRAPEFTNAELALIEPRTLAGSSAAQICRKLRRPVLLQAFFNARRQIIRDHRKTQTQHLFDRVNMWSDMMYHFWAMPMMSLPDVTLSTKLYMGVR